MNKFINDLERGLKSTPTKSDDCIKARLCLTGARLLEGEGDTSSTRILLPDPWQAGLACSSHSSLSSIALTPSSRHCTSPSLLATLKQTEFPAAQEPNEMCGSNTALGTHQECRSALTRESLRPPSQTQPGKENPTTKNNTNALNPTKLCFHNLPDIA